MKLTDNLFCYIWAGRGNNCHSYLFSNVLSGERPHVLIDPGCVLNEMQERCLDRLTASILQDGMKPEEIGLIINTHSHVDHCGASEALANMGSEAGTGNRALITLSKTEDEYRRGPGLHLHRMLGMIPEDFEPDFYLQEGELKLGNGGKNCTLQVIYTPGHCPGSISIYDPQHKALVAGDAVFNKSVGRTDFPGGDGTVLKQSIEQLSELDVEYLLPGHSTEFGNIIQGKEKVEENFAFIKKSYFPML